MILALGSLAHAQEPLGVRHIPPARAARGEPLAIAVSLSGASETAEVVAHHRSQGAKEFKAVSLLGYGGGRFEGTIPAEATSGLALGYYLEIRDSASRIELGSAAEPIQIPLATPLMAESQGPGRLWVLLASVGVGLLSVSRWLVRRDRRRENAILDRRFWLKLLHPLSRLHGQELLRAIAELTQAPVEHPIEGRRFYDRADLMKRLQEVQRVGRIIDRSYWLDTLGPLLALRGPRLAAELARISRATLSHPLDGLVVYSQSDLLHKLEDLRCMDLKRFLDEREDARFPGCEIDLLMRPGVA